MPFLYQILEILKSVKSIAVVEEIAGYTKKGEPLTASEMKNIIESAIDSTDNETAKTHSLEEVFERIL
jgi:hypothetical protein